MAGTLVLNTSQDVSTYGGATGYTFTLQVYVESQSVTDNQSSITVYHYAQSKNGYGYTNFSTPKSTIFISGTQVKQVTVATIPTNGTLTEICKYEGTITHDADGTKNITVTVNYNPNTTSYNFVPKNNTLSGTATLPRIARASTLITQGASFTIANTTTGFAYRVDSQARFYHKITWMVNDGIPVTAYDQLLIDGQGTTYFLMPTDLLNALGNNASGTLTITAYTYTDQGEDDLIGSSVRTADIAVDLSAIKPTLSLDNITINTTPISGYAIAGYSTVKIANWSTSGGLGTTSRTTYFSVSHGTLSTSESTRASGTNITTGALPESATDYTLTISAYTVDDRGATSDTVSKTITVKGYTKPQAGLTAYRVSSVSSTTEDGTGQVVYIKITGDYTQVGNNAITDVSLTYAGSKSGTISLHGYNHETWLTLGVDQYLTFTYTVTDRVASTTVPVYVSTAKLPLDVYDDGRGTVGVGLGAPAKINKIVFGLQTEGISYNDLSDKPSRATVISQTNIEATSGTTSGLITGQRFTQGFNSRFSSAFSTALTSSAITSSLGYTPVNKRGDSMTGQLLTSFKSSVAMGSYGTSTTTIPALMNEVRYSSGCMGSISVNTAYTLNGITIPTGWYNFIYTPHRSGGNSGQASGDNHLYGNLLLFGMNNSNGMYRIRYSNGISEVERFLFSGTIIARSAARTIAATTNYFYKVVLSSTLVSGHSEIFTITNGGIKVAFAGKYKVSASCYFQSGSNGSMPSVYIRTNNNADISASSSSASGMGTEKVAVSIPATTQAVPVVASPMLIDLARNDIVYLVGRSRQANGKIVCNNNMTYLQIEFLG